MTPSTTCCSYNSYHYDHPTSLLTAAEATLWRPYRLVPVGIKTMYTHTHTHISCICMHTQCICTCMDCMGCCMPVPESRAPARIGFRNSGWVCDNGRTVKLFGHFVSFPLWVKNSSFPSLTQAYLGMNKLNLAQQNHTSSITVYYCVTWGIFILLW